MNYYDSKYQRIGKKIQSENYKNTRIVSEYITDFRGNVLKEKITNSQLDNYTLVLENDFMYNNSNDLLNFKQKINSGSSRDILKNVYSDKGC